MPATAPSPTVLIWVTYWKLTYLLLGSHPLVRPDTAAATLVAAGGKPLRLVDLPLNLGAGTAGTGIPGPAASFLVNGWYTGPDGARPAGAPASRLISALGDGDPRRWQAWVAQHHYTFWVSYQPSGRYGTFQSIEAGTMLILALLLGAATIWLVRLRRA